ncbi:MAG: GNAT family N-acetyltransferase, partial [Muribaculaceae bacterium]|nr:GNAT family N-acetyltransferase [Muribaculaceae bacterium]
LPHCANTSARRLTAPALTNIGERGLSQITVQHEYRRKGIASRLLQEAIVHLKTNFIKVLNISSDNTTMPAFLQSKNIRLANKQFEMALPL